ncbi:MAG: hypothetical protein ACI4MJ_11095 [Aristaeellaceae bacterium]
MEAFVFMCVMLHLLVCLLCAVLIRCHLLRCPYMDVFILVFIPVFGLGSLLIHDRICRDEERKAKELELAQLTIDDTVQRSIEMTPAAETDEVVPLSEAFAVNDSLTQRLIMKEALADVNDSIVIDEDDVQEKLVPLQEALLLNDAHTKRELVMDVLYTNPSGYVPQLSQARENDDSEVVHYAVTALVEIQKEFDLQFQALSREIAARPGDDSLLRKHQRLLERYLSSGLLEGSRRDAQLRTYVEVLQKRLLNNAESLSLWIKKADADMLLQNLDDLREDAQRMIAFRPENEQGYLYLLKYYVLCKDAQGIAQVRCMVEQRGVYLSAEGRAELAFWQS